MRWGNKKAAECITHVKRELVKFWNAVNKSSCSCTKQALKLQAESPKYNRTKGTAGSAVVSPTSNKRINNSKCGIGWICMGNDPKLPRLIKYTRHYRFGWSKKGNFPIKSNPKIADKCQEYKVISQRVWPGDLFFTYCLLPSHINCVWKALSANIIGRHSIIVPKRLNYVLHYGYAAGSQTLDAVQDR